MQEIYQELMRCKRLNINGALGTIISTKGSTYQKKGAKCFIAEDGKITGLVSGGCVEGDLREIVSEVIESGIPKTIHYNFQDEGDLLWGLGLGCNGKINILLEPYIPNGGGVKTEQIENWFNLGSQKTLHNITVVNADDPNVVGSKWIIDPENDNNASIPPQIMADYYKNVNSLPILSSIQTEVGNYELFYDTISPPPHLLVFGAGPDAIPLVNFAKNLKWHVTVMDYRPGFVNHDNFPDADKLIRYKHGEIPDVPLDDNTYVVIMSHHFLQDQMMLGKVIHSDAAYIGLLGPRKRTTELTKGLNITNHANFHRVHSPIGLDIGSKTPEEIALSIIAEITMVYRGGTGDKLTEREGEMTLAKKEEALT